MSSDDYGAYCAMPTDDDESHTRLHAGLAKFGLKQLQLPAAAAQPLRSDAAGAPTMARQPSSTAAAPQKKASNSSIVVWLLLVAIIKIPWILRKSTPH